MQKLKFIMTFCILVMFFVNCSSTNQINPLGRSFGKFNDPDPLKIGLNPKPPAVQSAPSLVDSASNVPAVPLDPPMIRVGTFKGDNALRGPMPRLKSENQFNDVAVFENRGYPSDFVTIMNPNGGALTVWGLAAGNWIWGYTLSSSKPFGDARVWQLIEFPNDMVMIKNAKTNTCLNSYGNGIVHYPCDQSNHAQFWRLFPMSNGAYQIQNFANQKCIQIPVINVMTDFGFGSFHITLVDCLKSGEKNLDRQWYITVPTFTTQRPYR